MSAFNQTTLKNHHTMNQDKTRLLAEMKELEVSVQALRAKIESMPETPARKEITTLRSGDVFELKTGIKVLFIQNPIASNLSGIRIDGNPCALEDYFPAAFIGDQIKRLDRWNAEFIGHIDLAALFKSAIASLPSQTL